MKILKILSILSFLLLSGSCSSDNEIESKEEIDLSGIWYLSERTLTSNELESDWLDEYNVNEEGRMVFDDNHPSLLVGASRYEIFKLSDGTYKYRTYSIMHSKQHEMSDADYQEMLAQGAYSVLDLKWGASKEMASFKIEDNKWLLPVLTLEIIKIEKDYIRLRWRDTVFDGGTDIEHPIDMTIILRRSSNKVLPVESNNNL